MARRRRPRFQASWQGLHRRSDGSLRFGKTECAGHSGFLQSMQKPKQPTHAASSHIEQKPPAGFRQPHEHAKWRAV